MAIPNLKTIRIKRNLSQGELAKLSGIHRGTIAYYETVEDISPSHAKLARLAEALGVRTEELASEKPWHPIFDWRKGLGPEAKVDITEGVPGYVLERPDIQRIIKANQTDDRLELLKLWEYMPDEQYRVTVLSLFYGAEDRAREISGWDSLIPSQKKWEDRFLPESVRIQIGVLAKKRVTSLAGASRKLKKKRATRKRAARPKSKSSRSRKTSRSK